MSAHSGDFSAPEGRGELRPTLAVKPSLPTLILHHSGCKCAGRAGERKVRLPSLCCARTLILRETLSGTVISITVLFVPTTSLPVFITIVSDLICLLSSFILSGPFCSQALRPHPGWLPVWLYHIAPSWDIQNAQGLSAEL